MALLAGDLFDLLPVVRPQRTAAAPAAATVMVPVLVVVGVPNRVHFDSGSDNISAAGRRILHGYAQALKANPDARVELSGFADPTGDTARNLELAKHRAQTVRDALVAAGVAAERVALVKPTDVIVGQGSDADARRVDILLR